MNPIETIDIAIKKHNKTQARGYFTEYTENENRHQV